MIKRLIYTSHGIYQHHYDGNKNWLVKLPCMKCDIERRFIIVEKNKGDKR